MEHITGSDFQTTWGTVKLVPGCYDRPFYLRDKTYIRDTEAIWATAEQPQNKALSVKRE